MIAVQITDDLRTGSEQSRQTLPKNLSPAYPEKEKIEIS
jgi:hypothetical protein